MTEQEFQERNQYIMDHCRIFSSQPETDDETVALILKEAPETIRNTLHFAEPDGTASYQLWVNLVWLLHHGHVEVAQRICALAVDFEIKQDGENSYVFKELSEHLGEAPPGDAMTIEEWVQDAPEFEMAMLDMPLTYE